MTESDAMKQMENAIGDLVKEVKPQRPARDPARP